jgi:sulfur-carrier protein
MPWVRFTRNLQKLVDARDTHVEGATVADALAACFALDPSIERYVLDDQGAVRRHVAVFVNGALVADRAGLSDPVGADDEVYVMQALSGG